MSAGVIAPPVAAVTEPPFATAQAAIEDIRDGRPVVVVCDGEDRESEGVLVLAAPFATADAINFMAKEARGLICLALTPERCEALGLPLMAGRRAARFDRPFTVSVEARDGVTTGISTADRAQTIRVAIDPRSTPADLVHPGHVFPLKARPGGVLEHAGQAEAAVDLTRLAGLDPAGVVCAVMNDDGTMARVADLVAYCERHGLKMVTVADVVAHRQRHDRLVERVVSTTLPTEAGDFTAVGFRSLVDERHHVALVKGDVAGDHHVVVDVHAECLAGDVFRSLRCACGEQLSAALAAIERAGCGVLVYLGRGGDGVDLGGEGAAACGPRSGDERVVAQVLADLGVAEAYGQSARTGTRRAV